VNLKLGFPFACMFMLGDKYSVFENENEVLFNDGCNFDVVSVGEFNDNPLNPYTLIVLKTSSGLNA
jgi:hypothetical protein